MFNVFSVNHKNKNFYQNLQKPCLNCKFLPQYSIFSSRNHS
ncbi:hypothetical protein [Moraxella lacunata]